MIPLEELNHLQSLADAATPGPWKIQEQRRSVLFRVKSGDEIPPISIAYDCYQDDAAFISAAREAVPALIADARRLRAGFEQLAFGSGYSAVGKNDKCPHGFYGYEECAQCLEAFAVKMLEGGTP